MRIIPEEELAPDDYPCWDCNRIRVTPINITDAELDSIEESYWDYRETWGYQHVEPAMPFHVYLKDLIELKQKELNND